MKTIDYIYRFDPGNPTAKPLPPNAAMARRALEEGNRMFSKWMECCQTNSFSPGEPRFVVPCSGLEVGISQAKGGKPKHSPFAVVVGCSDARVPIEMLFGQGFNDMFVIRVAGNVLGDECLGSIDFALAELSESVKVVVVLGHSGCGAVTGAVDAYLQPLKFWSKTISPNLREILQRIFVSVREAANGLKEVWGPGAHDMAGYREALIEAAVCLNAAQAAYTLYQEVEKAGKWGIEVLYGVYDLSTYRISMPAGPGAAFDDRPVNLTLTPTSPREFNTLALQLAERLRAAPPPVARGARSPNAES